MPNLSILPEPAPTRAGGTRIVGRALTCAVFALAGLLFYVSAHAARGTDLRTDDSLLRLSDVIRQRSAQNQQAQAQLADLQERAEELAQQQGSPADAALLGALQQGSALEPLAGPGLTVTLNDAPPNATARIPGVPAPGVNDLVIHQQDIQAVVNALWRGGAEGIQVMDQRLISTSAVRCVGNTLLLQGRVYSPPYVIRAVGRTEALRSAVDADPTIRNYLQYVQAYGLGWKVQESGDLSVPGYSGTVDLRSAAGQ
ncbi:membrane protein [Kitasatospora herbaricolor]|nr:membrane protein [Kitasatospora herbaricolor]